MAQRLFRSLCAAFFITGLAACGVEAPAEETQPEAPQETTPHSERAGLGLAPEFTERTLSGFAGVIDPRKTLAVTDRTILASFPLQAVFNQLAAQNGTTGFTSTQLFRQLWDTQNPAPGQSDLNLVTSYAHCSDNSGQLNGFPYACRPAEGAEAVDTTPTTMATYEAVGLYNRFDLAPVNGANCGEYRIVYAKRSGGGRNFIIFEAVLPNPQPALGVEGCRTIANFWRNLSDDTSVTSRATKLQKFYFEGRDAATNQIISMPVVHFDNYGNRTGNTGQVRTNQFRGGPWMLHEFKTQRTCGTSGCILKFAPVTVKTNPFGGLFNPGSADTRAAQFQSHFLTQVASLAVNNLNTFSYAVPDSFNSGQSNAQDSAVPDNYLAQFGTGASTFRTNIQNQLTSIGSTLTPDQIVARAQAQSCGGCHQRSNGAVLGGGLTFPPSAGFVHSSELTEAGPDGERFRISTALTGTFLPHRQQVLASFLDTPVRNAVFVSQSVPTSVAVGQSFTVSVTMRNTGTHAWTAGQSFKLGSQAPQDNTTWGVGRVLLGTSEAIHQGQQKTFTFTVTAPTAPGQYAFQWRMLQEAVVWFGGFTPQTTINVVSLTTDPCNCPSGSVCPDVECNPPQ